MSIGEVIKANRKEKKSNTSSRNPQFYNKQRLACLNEIAFHEDAVVRKAFAMSSNAPASIVKEMLAKEKDCDVLKVVIMNPNLSKKAIFDFAESDDVRCSYFSEEQDADLYEYIESLASTEDE